LGRYGGFAYERRGTRPRIATQSGTLVLIHPSTEQGSGLFVNTTPEIEHMGQSIGSLFERPPHERAVIYRDLAADAERLANEVHTPSVQASYFELAAQWRKLAEQIGGGHPFDPRQRAIEFPKPLQS
jgi:hypothetical protein